jgi:hypothetical protein
MNKVSKIKKYLCKHGILGDCEQCWAEGFRKRRLNNPDYREAIERLRAQEALEITPQSEIDRS